MKKYLAVLVFARLIGNSSFSHSVEVPFKFEKSKDVITTITYRQINLGERALIDGIERTMPGSYLKDNGNSYSITRLSVVPPTTIERWKPYLQIPTANSIIVSWKAPETNIPFVKYGLSKDKLDKIANGTFEIMSDTFNGATTTLNFKKVKLEGLTPSTLYFYKVTGDETIYSFRTQPALGDQKPYRILLLGDHHMIERSGYEWLIAAARKTVEKKYKGTLEENINMVYTLGDQVDRGRFTNYERDHFYKSSYYSPYIPTITTIGNHDPYDDVGLGKYNKLYSYEKVSYKGIRSNTEAYYAIQEGSVLFISLCGENDYANDVQLSWLKSVIETADKDETIKFIVSSSHRPIASETWIDDFSQWLKDKAVPILGSSPKHVLLASGHHHYYNRGQIDNYDFHHLITGGAAWEQRWDTAPSSFDDNLIQKTHDYWTYVIVEFDPQTQRMTAETYSIGHDLVAHNNLLIDKFTRYISVMDKPDTPTINDIKNGIKLAESIHSSIYKSASNNDFNPANYQIASDETFKDIAYEKMLHFENFFKDSGFPNYLPINTQKNKSYFELPLKDSNLSEGNYYIRVRYRNQNLRWSDWSKVKKFEVESDFVPQEDKEPLISFEHTLYKEGDPVEVKFNNVPTGKNAWIGMYKQGDQIPGLGTVSYAYTDDNNEKTGSGKVSFTTDQHKKPLTECKYFFVLFGTGGYEPMLTPQMDFSITKQGAFIELSSNKTYYKVGEPIEILCKNARSNGNDWIGIYAANHSAGVNGGPSADDYIYTKNIKEGKVTFTKELTAGCYYISYFLDGAELGGAYTYNEASQRIFINIGEKVSKITATKENKKDDYVNIQLTDLAKFPLCWMVVKKTNGAEVERRFIKTAEKNQIISKKYPAGNYTVELQSPEKKAISNIFYFNVNDETGINTQKDKLGNGFHPNPVKNLITLSQKGLKSAKVYDLSGILLMNLSVVENQIDLSTLNSGYYFIIATSEAKQYKYRIIKE